MTPFAKTQLPASVNTVEKLAAWSSALLAQLYPQQTALEGDGAAERVAQFGVYYVSNNDTNRILARLSVQVQNDYLVTGAKVWDATMSLGESTIPTSFTS